MLFTYDRVLYEMFCMNINLFFIRYFKIPSDDRGLNKKEKTDYAYDPASDELRT